jgi:hypothetical protein
MAETGRTGRSKKAFLGRIKILAVILSIVAFFGSLAGVVIANPATAQRSQQPVQTVSIRQSPDLQAQASDGSLLAPGRSQVPRIRPMTRTRGS